jgi:flavin reductase (DIM6/NTAB) family NADH-FMN oxidoreductase RutF
MHYTPDKNDHGLAYSPFNALVSPRPIGWISTLTPTGLVNLAPYSFYNAVSGHPPFVMFASSTPKDSRRNAEQAGEFVVNLAGYAMRDAMGRSSEAVAEEVSEPDLLGIDMAPSIAVKTPRVALAQAALECRYDKTVELHDRHGALLPSAIIIGEVIGVYVDDTLIVDGRVDITRARPLARLGYKDYAVIDEVFAMHYP